MIVEGLRGIDRLLGQRLGDSAWHRLTQEDVDRFAETTGDDQWIHTDVQRSLAGPFGGPIVHGFLILSTLPKLRSEVLEVSGVRLLINAGLDRVRFLAPLAVGARFRAGFEVVSVESHRSGRRVVFRAAFRTDEDIAVCIADAVTIAVGDD